MGELGNRVLFLLWDIYIFIVVLVMFLSMIVGDFLILIDENWYLNWLELLCINWGCVGFFLDLRVLLIFVLGI